MTVHFTDYYTSDHDQERQSADAMACILPYDRAYISGILALVNDHVAAVPPLGASLSVDALDTIIRDYGALWALHGDGHCTGLQFSPLIALENDRVSGIAVPSWMPGDSEGQISLFVVDPSNPSAGDGLLSAALDVLSKNGCTECATEGRNPIGIGWSGIPSGWPHVCAVFERAGFTVSDDWVILVGSTDAIPIEPPRPANEMIHCILTDHGEIGEWRLEFFHEDELVGECEVWAVPPHLAGEQVFRDWITVEWVGVDPAFRQRGLAFWLMVKQFHYHLRAGRKHVMLWTGPGNHAARKLYYRLGFSDGPHTLLYSLPILPV